MTPKYLAPRMFLSGAVVWALCATSLEAQAEVPISKNAAELFAQGVEHLRLNRADSASLAFVAFTAAYADSASWKILGNLGLSAFLLERYQEADTHLRRYLQEGSEGLTDEEKTSIRRKLNIIGFRRAQLNIEVPGPGAFSIIDERSEQLGTAPVINEYGPFEPLDNVVRLTVRAGNHRLRVVREGCEEGVWAVEVEPGEEQTKTLELTAIVEPQTEPPLGAPLQQGHHVADVSDGSSAVPWAMGFGGGFAIVGVGLLMQANSVQDEERQRFRTQCEGQFSATDAACYAVTAGSRNAASWRTAGALSIGLAAASLTTAAAYYWLSDPDDPSASEQAASEGFVRAAIAPWAVSVTGRF